MKWGSSTASRTSVAMGAGRHPGPTRKHFLLGADTADPGLDPAVFEHALKRSQVVEQVPHEQPKLFTGDVVFDLVLTQACPLPVGILRERGDVIQKDSRRRRLRTIAIPIPAATLKSAPSKNRILRLNWTAMACPCSEPSSAVRHIAHWASRDGTATKQPTPTRSCSKRSMRGSRTTRAIPRSSERTTSS